MTDHPILFSAPMVRALLDGTKTQTRRVLKPQPVFHPDQIAAFGYDWHWTWLATKHSPTVYANDDLAERIVRLLKVKRGDRFWVRETIQFDREWDDAPPREMNEADAIRYDADGHQSAGVWGDPFYPGKKRPGIHMPRWASRITLKVTDVRVQPLKDISDDDAVAEGIESIRYEQGVPVWRNYLNDSSLLANGGLINPTAGFLSLWNSLNGPDAWALNPWVVAYTFDVHKWNIDQVAA